ncbi:amino acid adenylation domain-containing protein [Paenibacillus sp. SC116]|uniref:non-ribosomal peptide synthetase n=1 Tax=Paenibacillus sp. SC116 TaxID=2968986 RepID=UPI00215A8FF4|nr:non-ribosomal peptide synthetase [Paenibacillus sp. SC116]MCR8844949.1 amino acid adenylation domain-containing protein [Paenibacillus sp. SC116]
MTVKPEGSQTKQALLEKMLRGRKPRQTIKRQEQRDWAPASFQQQRLWLLEQLYPGSSAYNIPYIFKIHGEIDTAVLKQSIDGIYNRHDVLRVRFEMQNDILCQISTPEHSAPFQEIDLQAVPEEEREKRVQGLLMEKAQIPFHIGEGDAPLLRTFLFRIDSGTSILLISMHHIVSDGWSASVLFRELTAFINALSQGMVPELKELPIQYSDYAIWQKQQVQEDHQFAQSMEHWKAHLSGELPFLQLPTDRKRPPVQRFKGQEVYFQLDPKLSNEIIELCRRENVSLYMFLLTVFNTLLFRYSAQEDILIGSPIANRNVVETEALIGFFVNTIVMRTDLSGQPTFLELLQRVKQVALDNFMHQSVPFEKLIEAINPERTLSHSPLFQVMFTLQNTPEEQVTLDGLRVEQLEIDLQSTKFDLMLGMQEGAQGLSGTFTYSCDLFDLTTIERMSGHFQTLVRGIVSNSNQPLTEIPLLTDEEQHQLLIEWNQSQLEYPSEVSLYRLFEEQALRTPHATAVEFEGLLLTYQQLKERASYWTNHLQKLGAKSGESVGLCMERSLDMVVALLAIMRTGAAYVPLDPSLPINRIQYMMENAGVSLLLSTSNFKDDLANLSARIVCIDQEVIITDGYSGVEAVEIIPSNHPLYVIYTSGSTGKPKGVVVTHQNVVNRLQWMKEAYCVSDSDCVLQKASIGFDVSVWEIFLPLISGARLVLSHSEKYRDPAYLINEIGRTGVTMIHFIPSMLRLFLDHPEVQQCNSLRVVSTGGESLPYELQQRFFEVFDAELHNRYGPTEITINATHWRCDPNSSLQIVPIGRPLGNTSLYVLDAQQHPVPIGVPGELYIGGDSVALAYKGQEKITQEKFMLNPYTTDGSRMYRSGDMVRWLNNGSLEFLGRMDDQVKISGYRIELGEINALLTEHPDVLENYVDTFINVQGTPQLIVYVVWRESGGSTYAELRRYLETKLPNYMVPAHYVTLNSIPVTQNGKVDRILLSSMKPDEPCREQQVLPRNSLEETISVIWCELLGLQQIDVFDTFFDLGGHSLLAMQTITRIRQQLDCQIPLRVLFEKPTIAAIAEYIHANAMDQSVQISAEGIGVADRRSALPLSFGQQRLWFLEQLDPGNASYLIPSFYRLNGQLDIQALEQSIHHVVMRHETLRTVFQVFDVEPVQVILPTIDWKLPIEVLSAREKVPGKESVLERMRQDAAQPFGLTEGPLFRVKLYRTGEQEYYLLLVLHHIISDGWSQPILIKELSAHYESLIRGNTAVLPPLPIQYADFAAWQRNWLQEDVLQQNMHYWKQQFTGEVPVLQLPIDKPRQTVQQNNGAYYRFELSNQLSRALKGLSREQGATLFMTLLAAFKTLLHRYSGQEDIVVGTPVANRNSAEIEGLIGFFVNTIALRTDMSGNPSFLELLNRVRNTSLGAFAHQDLPFEQLVKELQVERDMSRTPIFQSMFVMQNAVEKLKLSGLKIEEQDVDTGEAEFELTLIAEETEQGLLFDFSFDTDLFEKSTIVRMAAHFELLLQGIIDHPATNIGQLPLLSDDERQMITVAWNDTAKSYPIQFTIQQQFEQLVERIPDRLALECSDEQMTYGELNQKANQLAHTLRNGGIRADSIVAIMAKPSLEMIIGVLAILKAGGAYLPIDPATPAERVSVLLRDSGTRWLLTHLDQIPELSFTGSLLSLADSELYASDRSNLPLINGPEHLCVVLYTSGTTGTPKGVMIEHRHVVSYTNMFIDHFHMSPIDRVLQQASLAFDNSIEEILIALLSGASLFVINKFEFLDMQHITEWLRKKEITVISTTALMVNELSQHLRDHKLRLIISGGDALKSSYISNLANVQVYNTYGPTETTICSTAYLCLGVEGEMVPIGTPFNNEQVWVLDRYRNVVPIGVVGELFISGAGVTRGYLNRPDLTAEKFVEHPFLPDTKMYRTGDLVRWLADGNLEFIGREDQQVKLRGLRVELGEIESILMMNDSVKEALVMVREEQKLGKYLVAYMVLENGNREENGLREYLMERVPSYMIPAAFVILDKIPLNQNGKVDRKVLPIPLQITEDRELISPRTDMEKRIAEVWSQVLGREEIGIVDNFFQLGGHSLLLTQVTLRLRSVLQVEIPVRLLFEAPTIIELAKRIELLTEEKPTVTTPLLKRVQRTKKIF